MEGCDLPRIVITAGEPAGIGPDIVLDALSQEYAAEVTVISDTNVMRERAEVLGRDIEIISHDPSSSSGRHTGSRIHVMDVPVEKQVIPGQLDPDNVDAVIQAINEATDSCLEGRADAMVTAPVHKAVINDGGIPFSGHTEWIAERAGGARPVMMLASPGLRVCLATTHMPLSAVPAAITGESLEYILEVMSRDIGQLFGIRKPILGVLGLNPHAGEGGYLGTEEVDTILPALQRLRARGMNLIGPLPADTAFTQDSLAGLDAVLAMYHDQGLPVVKHQGFGEVVNVTLGIPLIRTSVDHGTALDLAGSGKASAGSLVAAIRLAIEFAGASTGRGEECC